MGLYKWDLLVILWDLGSGYVKMLLLKMAIEIVDSMVIFHSYVAVYQRGTRIKCGRESLRNRN